MQRYRMVTLCIDVMFVNKIPMLVSISRNIKFGTVEDIANRNSASLIKGIRNIVKIYQRAGFKVNSALMDGEFEPLRGDLAEMGIGLNVTSQDEHVGDVERYIRTIKERMRAIYNTLPFENMPPRMVIEMAKSSVFWLNAFPHCQGVSNTLSPRTIITGQNVDFNRHCKHQFGEYVQTHEEHNNSMAPRTIGALALRPTGNSQGSFYYLSLSTGRIINRRNATSLPMPEDVVSRVHTLARRQKANAGLLFMDRNNSHLDDAYDSGTDSESEHDDVSAGDNYFDDDNNNEYHSYSSDEDSEYVPNNEDSSLEDDDDEYNHDQMGVQQDIIGNRGEIAGVQDGVNNDNQVVDQLVHDDENLNDITNDSDHLTASSLEEEEENDDEYDNDIVADTDHEMLENDMNVRYGERTGRYELRPRRNRDYSHLFTTSGEPLSTPQMNMNKGISMFGADGVKAVKNELQQLHDRKVMAARHHTDLSFEQKREALAYLMFLKRKRCGKIKGRGCADGRKQRAYIAKEDAASPTVATEAVFLTAVVDALEGREVAVVDVPGAFMQADMDEVVHVRFTGKMVELLLEIDENMYKPYVTLEKGEKVMYVELLKALYGTIRAARLFWEKLSKKLQEWGFQCNQYDSCVANKTVNGKQLTVAWHVDDLKVSHVETKVVDEFLEQMEEEFGKETPMNKSRGKVHDYLGMVLDFSNEGAVKISMVDYIKMVLHDLPPEMVGSATTPAANYLFNVDSNSKQLDKQRKDVYVHYVMQLLYLSQRARPDIRTAISFLCTRLTAPDEDDYKKLIRVMKYLQSTMDLPLILSANGLSEVHWWVDASFAVHPEMKGHTGGTMSLGAGSIYSTSVKQKMVTRSSTESEVVGVYDILPQMIWTSNFLKGQGLNVEGSVLYQDNKSAILLESNGRQSSSKRTRHMNIRYFFIKDSVDSKEVKIKYCATDDMLADFFTKPLQGHKFRVLRDSIMNIDLSSEYHSGHRSVLNQIEPQVDDGSEHLGTDVAGSDVDKIPKVE
jgi:Reverse transcriptase (RNA-dependent DNA polymerase)